jgi:hypothetical protein
VLDTLLKGLELLLGKLKDASAPDKKREKLARELLQIYLDVAENVHRGREILAVYEYPSYSDRAILLLSQQLRTLQRLTERLTQDPVASIVSLHLPNLSRELGFAINFKRDRVWLGLDLLVSDGQQITANEWIARLQSRMSELSESDLQLEMNQYMLRHSQVLPFADFDMYVSARPREETTLIGSPEELRKGHLVLDRLEAVGAGLHTFLLEKFKFEDVL